MKSSTLILIFAGIVLIAIDAYARRVCPNGRCTPPTTALLGVDSLAPLASAPTGPRRATN
jgi:hypothetical protein